MLAFRNRFSRSALLHVSSFPKFHTSKFFFEQQQQQQQEKDSNKSNKINLKSFGITIGLIAALAVVGKIAVDKQEATTSMQLCKKDMHEVNLNEFLSSHSSEIVSYCHQCFKYALLKVASNPEHKQAFVQFLQSLSKTSKPTDVRISFVESKKNISVNAAYYQKPDLQVFTSELISWNDKQLQDLQQQVIDQTSPSPLDALLRETTFTLELPIELQLLPSNEVIPATQCIAQIELLQRKVIYDVNKDEELKPAQLEISQSVSRDEKLFIKSMRIQVTNTAKEQNTFILQNHLAPGRILIKKEDATRICFEQAHLSQ